MDPNNPNWHEKLGIRLRCLRKEIWSAGKPCFSPSKEETNALAKAYELRPDVPKFFVSLSRNIAEILRNKNYNLSDHVVDIQCGSISFKTVQDALTFMKKNTR